MFLGRTMGARGSTGLSTSLSECQRLIFVLCQQLCTLENTNLAVQLLVGAAATHRVLVMAPYCSAFSLSVNIRRSVILCRCVTKSQTHAFLRASWAAHTLSLVCFFFPRCGKAVRELKAGCAPSRCMERGCLLVSSSPGWPNSCWMQEEVRPPSAYPCSSQGKAHL